MCRNLHWNEFCDSPYVEVEIIEGGTCAWCNTQDTKRKMVLEEMRDAEIIDVVEDDEEVVMEKEMKNKRGMKKKEKRENKITDHFSVAKSKSVVAGPAKAASW